MAQLIKLQDYITRYEWDTFRYPTQFIRLKNENWNKLYRTWSEPPEPEMTDTENIYQENESVFKKVKNKFKKQKHSQTIQEDEAEPQTYLPDTELELRHYFLDNLFKFQMKWATSTVTHASFINKKYYREVLLKYLLKRFPDNYLVMYHPVFEIKNAPIETDIILISPLGIEIIHYLDKGKDTTILAGDERTWIMETPHDTKKFLNPNIAVKRTEKLLKSILTSQGMEFDIKKTILSKENNIVYVNEPYNTRVVGKSNYDAWFQEKRALDSPLKNQQIKVAEILLKNCQTTAVKRPEWEEDSGSTTILDMEK